MTKVIAIANQKGGVGKTSTTVNLGAGLARQGYAVLAIDFDPQANLTMALGFKSPDDMEYTVSNVLAKAMDEEPIDPAEGILTTEEGVDLMPSSIQLSRYELSLVNEMNRESMLRQFVDAAKPNYDSASPKLAPKNTAATVKKAPAKTAKGAAHSTHRAYRAHFHRRLPCRKTHQTYGLFGPASHAGSALQ